MGQLRTDYIRPIVYPVAARYKIDTTQVAPATAPLVFDEFLYAIRLLPVYNP